MRVLFPLFLSFLLFSLFLFSNWHTFHDLTTKSGSVRSLLPFNSLTCTRAYLSTLLLFRDRYREIKVLSFVAKLFVERNLFFLLPLFIIEKQTKDFSRYTQSFVIHYPYIYIYISIDVTYNSKNWRERRRKKRIYPFVYTNVYSAIWQ